MQMEKENCRLAKKRNDIVILSDPEHSEGESKDPHTFSSGTPKENGFFDSAAFSGSAQNDNDPGALMRSFSWKGGGSWN